MNIRRYINPRTLALPGMAVLCLAATAEAADRPFSFEISSGAEYDSNISVDQVDTNTGSGDYAALIDGEVGFEHGFANGTTARLGYIFSQSLHADFTDFDLQSHQGYAEIEHDFGGFDLGGSYRYVDTSLGGDGFLVYQAASLYGSRYLTKKLLARATYSYADKNFQIRQDRDATVHGGGLDLFYFIKGSKTYILAGYKYEHEAAFADEFDYDSHDFKIRLSQRFQVGQAQWRWKIGWRYEKRDYGKVTPSINEVRSDDRHRFETSLEVPLGKILYAEAEYEYGDFSSNLPSADYTQHYTALRLGARF